MIVGIAYVKSRLECKVIRFDKMDGIADALP